MALCSSPGPETQAFPAIFEFLKQETGVAGMCKPFRSQCDYHCRSPLLQSRCLESALKYPSCGSIKFIQHSVVSQNFSRLSLSKLSFIHVCGCKVYDTTNVHALWFSLKGYVGTSNHLHIPSVHINRVWTVCAVHVFSAYHFQKGMSVVARAVCSTSSIIVLAIVTDSGDHLTVQ